MLLMNTRKKQTFQFFFLVTIGVDKAPTHLAARGVPVGHRGHIHKKILKFVLESFGPDSVLREGSVRRLRVTSLIVIGWGRGRCPMDYVF